MDVRGAPWLAAAVLVCSAGLWIESNSVRGATLDDEDGWYAPTEDDYRPEYDRDRVNQRVQTWNQYWGWVTSFYNGNAFSAGWSRQAKASVGVVKSATKQKELTELLNDLGKRISMEWAKDNGVRKISTADLNRWNSVIIRAQRAEKGTGDRLQAALLQVRAEVTRKMGRQPAKARGRG
ncbi:MAG TPA: hypothetical protein VKA15_26935 [Isosphaeraceae bacterium]|nr:hypothetical protein [Isosphaeraceae bacterium]